MPRQRNVAVNDAGLRIGESHQNSTISNAHVALMRNLHERDGYTYRQILAHFRAKGILLRYPTVKKICNYERRNQVAARFKEGADGSEEGQGQQLASWLRAIEGDGQASESGRSTP